MKAHERMLLNSKLMKALPYSRHDGYGAGCALGMIEGPDVDVLSGNYYSSECIRGLPLTHVKKTLHVTAFAILMWRRFAVCRKKVSSQ